MSDAAKLRAAAALDLPEDADAAAARARFLARLPREQFLPPNEWLAALAVLGTEVPLNPEAIAEREAFERAGLEAFLAEYWSLEPAARRKRWDDLKAQSHVPGILARLEDVNAGLAVIVTSFADAQEAEIASVVRECYLLPPRARAVRRAEWVAERGDVNIWKAAAIRFRDADPATAALEPVLLDYLLRPHTAPRIVAALSDEQLEKIAVRREKKGKVPLEETIRRQAQEEKPGFSLTEFNIGSYWWIGVVIVFILRGCVAMMGTSTLKPANYNPPIQYPANPSTNENLKRAMEKADGPLGKSLVGKPLDLSTIFTAEELAAFEAYDPKSMKPAPPRYATWRLMGGRPGTSAPENP